MFIYSICLFSVFVLLNIGLCLFLLVSSIFCFFSFSWLHLSKIIKNKNQINSKKVGFTYHLCNLILEIIIEQLTCYYEQIFDIFTGHSRCFKWKFNISFTLELFNFFDTYFSLVSHIKLVSNKENNDFRFTLRHYLIIPRG